MILTRLESEALMERITRSPFEAVVGVIGALWDGSFSSNFLLTSTLADAMSLGTFVVVDSGTKVLYLDQNDNSASHSGKLYLFDIATGATLSTSNFNTLDTVDGVQLEMCKLDENKVLIAYAPNGNNDIDMFAVDTTGGTIAIGTGVTLTTTKRYDMGIAKISTTKVAIFYGEDADADTTTSGANLIGRYVDVSGTTITLGTRTTYTGLLNIALVSGNKSINAAYDGTGFLVTYIEGTIRYAHSFNEGVSAPESVSRVDLVNTSDYNLVDHLTGSLFFIRQGSSATTFDRGTMTVLAALTFTINSPEYSNRANNLFLRSDGSFLYLKSANPNIAEDAKFRLTGAVVAADGSSITELVDGASYSAKVSTDDMAGVVVGAYLRCLNILETVDNRVVALIRDQNANTELTLVELPIEINATTL